MPLPEQDSTEIRGTTLSVVYQNPDNGYAVLQIEDDSGERSVVRGRLPAATVGENIHAEGKWIVDKRFGRQFDAHRIAALPPTSTKGILHFLSSGIIDGIGPAYARRIVETFGTDTFRIINEESQRLQEIRGIGKARRLRIRESWKRLKSIRDLMIFLHHYGLSTARALRLYKLYGEEAANILRADPYRLARDVAGIGFHTADDIAQKMGKGHDSPFRCVAGLQHILNTAERQGHCALPQAILLQETANLLAVAPEELAATLETSIRTGEVVVESLDGEDLVYTPRLFHAEQIVADATLTLLAAPVVHPAPQEAPDSGTPSPNPIPKPILNLLEHSPPLSKEQLRAVECAASHRFSILTGGPGTGKTTVMRSLIARLLQDKIHPVLCAPTGRAARRLSESTGQDAFTLHRALEYQPHSGFARNRQHPMAGDFFIVDEASMVDIELMASLLAAIPEHAGLLLVGDADQLPSVGAGNVLSDLIESGIVPIAQLRQIYRQSAGSRIIDAAHLINAGKLPPLDPLPDSDFFFLPRTDPESIVETLLQLITDRIPKRFGFHPRDDIQILTPMNRNSLGTKELNTRLQSALNPPSSEKAEIERFGTLFRTGDKVIQTRNNYEKEIFNGDIGHITSITTDPSTIHISFETHPQVLYEPDELDELQLAYAITIHKSQGSEFPAVIIPLARQHHLMLQRKLVYTAVTRGRKLALLVGEKNALSIAVQNRQGSKRYSGLKARLQKNASAADESHS